jgi:type III secretion protein C
MIARMKAFSIAFSLLCSVSLFSEDADELAAAALFKKEAPPAAAETSAQGYTINYNTVSIIEYIRFASKICNVNFIFNEADLDFTVTVVSDAPITTQNVMGTLVQVLRIHGLSILEQDNNLVIHKAPEVTQIATLVTDQMAAKNAPLVTRIFRIKEAKAEAIAGVIKPMISASALLEVLPETKQLILTDVTVNVDKVALLIEILDSPINQLGVRIYTTVHNSPEHLVEMAAQIMAPVAQGNPFILVPQPSANAIYIVSTSDLTEKTLAILKSLDVPPQKEISGQRRVKGENIFVYKAVTRGSDEILSGLFSIAENLQKTGIPEGDLIHTIESARSIKETNSIMFTGSKDSIAKVKEFLTALDAPGAAGSLKSSFFVYRPKYRSAKELDASLKEMAENLKGSKEEAALVQILQGAKINKTTNTILFSGDESQFSRINDLLTTVDTPSGKKTQEVKNDFFLYKIQHASYEDLHSSLKGFAKNLDKSNVQDEGLIQAIEEMKPITETNSILFSGPEAALNRLKELVPSFDSGIASMPVSNQFLVYKPKNQKGEQLVKSIHEVAGDLKSDQFRDPAFLRTLESMKYVKNTDSLIFTGDAASIARLEELIAKVDVPSGPKLEKILWLYSPKMASREKVETYLKQLSTSLDKQNESDLIQAIQSMKWIDASQSFLFQGTPPAIARLKEAIQNFDQQTQDQKKPGYFIYKLHAAPGEVVEEELDAVAKGLKESGLHDDKTLAVIRNMRYVKETNSLLLTGDPAAIEAVKAMIADYDYARTEPSQINSNFFMYKPQHQSAAQIEKSLHDIGENLKNAGLADPSLLKTINSANYVKTTNSLIFTGNADSIQKIQSLLKEVDIPSKEHAPIQHIGKTTFLLYKLKVAGGPQITTSIKTMAADLKKTGGADPELIAALNTMKYVKETNSLFFTGTEEALQKVQTLVEQFDVTALAAAPPAPEKPAQPGQTNFFLYKPVSLSAADLEALMSDFATNLHESGLTDPALFSAITSMRQVEKTQSLVFTGTPKALDQVKEILKAFDIPSNLSRKPVVGPLEPSIQAIDNTSFLVYKLQFHKGDEIQGALKQIAKDLLATNAPINQNLLNSINSIQWLDVTNSLLCSGTQETLTRLKELIKNLDIPLKQVFIEVLVIETSLTNALLFGLEWGGNYKFNDKFGISSFNTVPPPNAQAPFPDQFVSKLSSLTPPSQQPTPIGNIPPVAGFDLGVIGEVIKHNGNTFLTLGSLLNALQSDTETTIITAPKILGQDGRTSTIFSGANIPFTGSFVNNTTSGATILTSNIEYRDIGLNLTITPVLGNSDIVTLDINLDRSQTATNVLGQSQLNFQQQTANGIVTSKTTMQTTVHVPDRNFLVLSGFVNNSNTKVKQGIPCLGGLPMIGAAFSQQNDTISNQNVVIFLRPFIINSIEDMRRVTSEQELFFRDLSTTPFLEHNYDDAMELIKSVDDE